MAIRNIVIKGNPLLRMKSRPVTEFNDRLHILLDDMFDTMIKNHGCGIAAVQVGVLKRAVIIWHENELLELINPTVIECKGSQTDTEGCLSIDSSENCEVTRPYRVSVTAYSRFGVPFNVDAEGWRARIICHELDHLDGVLFTDRKASR